MLRILSSKKTLCDGISRRDLLQVGGLGVCGLGLNQLLASHTLQANESPEVAAPNFGRAKNCILLYLYGAPSQLETFDMKPAAPVEIRGTMQPIPSAVPGIDVCEYLPETAKMLDRVTVVRSVTHPYPLHGVAFATTGVPAIDVAMELAPYDSRHQPYFGSVVQYLDAQRSGGKLSDVPQNVALPFPFSSQRVGEVARAGPYAAYLGATYNPTWTEYLGKSTRSVYKVLGDKKIDVHDPYVGCDLDSHFRFAAGSPQPDVTLDRLSRRRSLLGQFDDQRREFDRTVSGRSLSNYQQLAFSMITSPKVTTALDVRLEPQATRDLYGMTLFGQACLGARRMIEAGTRLVSVFWDEYGLAGDAWDTHWNHFPRMTDQLLPGFDKAFSGLVLDLEQRGMLDDTLVVVLSDHGRTPKLNNAQGGGRDHWSTAYSLVFAGGGIARGKVVGATDRDAGAPTDRPVSPKDLLATMYHLLGIHPRTRIPDRAGSLTPIVPESADVIPEMLA
ncbi:MAG: DUF1501 domain-containing protein [Planctomycetaceae bacterium]|nr:DUF1501 domain-containing protein [Planctomycetaceae bacterium]